MTLNKKILVAAIVGGLFATAAQAQVTLSAETVTPVRVAAERNFAANGTLTTAGISTPFQIRTETGYAFSNQEVRYARVECSPNVRINATDADLSGLAVGGPPPVLPPLTFGNVNGSGTNVIRFSITATGAAAEDATIIIGGTRTFTSRDAATCTYSLYDLPSQAAAGGEAGRIAQFSGNYSTFANSYAYQNTTNSTASSVEASPSFSRFVTQGNATGVAGIAQIGRVAFDLVGSLPNASLTTPIDPSTGVAVVLGNILAPTGTGATDTHHIVSGDFSAAANADGTFTGANTRVFASANADCSGAPTVSASVTATTARFNVLNAPNLYICFEPRVGNLIPAAEYGIRLVPRSQPSYTAAPAGPAALGSIVRDGTSLQAQFAQVPAGWTSRIVLTNTGSLPRPYTITAQTEAGVTSVLGTAATGTIPANGTIVLNTADIATFTGQPRGTLNVSVAGPNSQIQGLYQIVNGQTGSIANTALVRPGTN